MHRIPKARLSIALLLLPSACSVEVDDDAASALAGDSEASEADELASSESGIDLEDPAHDADFDELASVGDPAAAGGPCVLVNASCPNNPALNNVTIDENPGSQTACWQRAIDWRSYCGRPTESLSTTRATWVPDTDGFNTFSAISTGCAIWVTGACPNHPEYANRSFWDDWDGSGSDPVRCGHRAQEYANWCGNPGSASVWAEFGKFTGLGLTPNSFDNTVNWTVARMAGCFVNNRECKNHPEYAGFEFYDAAGSGSYAACTQRVKDYRAWCGTTVAGIDRTDGRFHAWEGGDTWTPTAYSPGCVIDNGGSCPNYPTYAGRFSESYNGAATNVTACFNRAKDYRGWCGSTRPGVDTSSATFFGTDFSRQTKEVRSPGCSIEIDGACPNHPDYSNRFDISDTYNGAATSKTACEQRARDYYSWCGYNLTTNRRLYTTVATFTDATYTTQPEYLYPKSTDH